MTAALSLSSRGESKFVFGSVKNSGISWTEVLRAFKSARVKGSAIIKGRILARASKLLEDDKCAPAVG